MTMDIVMPYRKTNSNEILWAVMSFIKNMPHRNIYVIGDDPEISGVNWLKPELNRWAGNSKYHNQINAYLTACRTPYISNQFIAVNDDFFVMKHWTPEIYNKGTIGDQIKARVRHDEYRGSLSLTKRHLELKGLPTLNYELHTPFVFDKRKLESLINSLSLQPWKLWQIRSLYGNTYQPYSTQRTDVKNPENYKGEALLSTDNKTFRGELGEYIRSQLS